MFDPHSGLGMLVVLFVVCFGERLVAKLPFDHLRGDIEAFEVPFYLFGVIRTVCITYLVCLIDQFLDDL